MRNCDRIIVLSEGRVSGELDIADAAPEKIMEYAMGANHE